MKILSLVVLSGITGLSALAQTQPRDSVRAGARVEIAYFDVHNQKLSSAAGADHRVETSYTDSLKAAVRAYYSSGKLRSYTPYVNIKRHFVHGRFLEYYEDGQLHLQGDFIANKRQGDFLVYYPDGQLRRRDHYEAGQRTAGECFSSDGQPVTYFEYEQKPVYPAGDGGSLAVVTAIQHQIHYPTEALRYRLAGTIKVKFVVDAAGDVRDASVVGGVDETKFAGATLDAVRQMEAEVLKAVRGLERFRPGQRDGQNVSVAFSVPISFKIQ
ncbi:MAG: TonB family protein [Hymenobacter sp.]|nr:MAG: TonB family protein [Hymenobacter sp.]